MQQCGNLLCHTITLKTLSSHNWDRYGESCGCTESSATMAFEPPAGAATAFEPPADVTTVFEPPVGTAKAFEPPVGTAKAFELPVDAATAFELPVDAQRHTATAFEPLRIRRSTGGGCFF